MIEQILNQNTSKTNKMKQLFQLGYTRKQVAQMLGVNYGFAHNVYVSIYGTRRNPRIITEHAQNDGLGIWERTFGVEIEAYGVSKTTLKRKLQEAGINVEVEGYNHDDRNYWKIVPDASIKGENSFELVSPPLSGEQGLQELKKVCEVLKELNAQVNKTCGLHIHFDARNYELENWKRLVYNYMIMENEIDKMMPESRRANNNSYCKSLREKFRIGSLVHYGYTRRRIQECQTLEELSSAITDRVRYYKINIESYWRHKTVEFRHHSGTIEFEKIASWIEILNRLMNFSKYAEFRNSDVNLFYGILNQTLREYVRKRREKFGF